MLGGLRDYARDLETEGDYGAFEQTVNRVLGDSIREDAGVAIAMWCALANVDWMGPNGEDVGYSFRAAGDLVAAIRGKGDYLDWYCTGTDGRVAGEIAKPMQSAGWTFRLLR